MSEGDLGFTAALIFLVMLCSVLIGLWLGYSARTNELQSLRNTVQGQKRQLDKMKLKKNYARANKAKDRLKSSQ